MSADHDMIGGNCCAEPIAAPWEQAEADAEAVERHLLTCPAALLLPIVLISRALRRSGHQLPVAPTTPDEPRYTDVLRALKAEGTYLTLSDLQARVDSGNSETLLQHLALAVRRGAARQCCPERVRGPSRVRAWMWAVDGGGT
jgi:hypothetical protein